MSAMDCTTARDLMLEADLAELRGELDTPLAAHIKECDRCAAAAAHLLRSYDRLDVGMRQLSRPRRKQRWLPWAALPVAAAAVLALLITNRADEPVKENTQMMALMFREQPVVTPPAGKQAIVVEKNDLTVVWLY